MTKQETELFDLNCVLKARMSEEEAQAFRAASKTCVISRDQDSVAVVHIGADGRMLVDAPKPDDKTNPVLHLMLHGIWFDNVLYGDKRVEYRQIKPRWTKQIWEKRDRLRTLVLHRGYTSNVIRADITKIDIGPCPYKGWEGDYYRVWFELKGVSK